MATTENAARIQERLANTSWGLLGNQGYVLGLDLGGYGLRVGLINLKDHTCTTVHAEPSALDAQTMLAEASALARQHMEEMEVSQDRLVRIGVGFGGPVDPDRGTVLFSTRKSGWENVSLKDYFEQTFDTVTLADNDANVIALGEAVFGVGTDYQHLFYLHLSSGVGGGIVLHERVHHGATGMAGEIGHAVINQYREGQNVAATLEEMVSINGLLQRAQELGYETTNLHDLFGDHPVGQQVVQEAVHVLAARIAHVVALLDPQIIVLGGIVVRIGGEAFVQAIADNMNYSIAPALVRPVPVVASVLGNDSVAIGALALALDSLND